ncbi:MAG TPA: phospho-N-acetylmuramoyl-pentapeptide-transferase [Campylobacteraceae bacterium]|nr:phospho-N-acetylmuramoyl-pentapeptide-transferase [Campylobacteraceae bacterium]
MLYLFYHYFHINLFQYITVRAGISFFIGFILTLYLMPRYIRWAQRRKANQPIYKYAPEAHQVKSSTPTMGGIVFIFSTLIASLVTIKFSSLYAMGAILTIILFALIGLKDDLSKIKGGKNEEGLSSRAKMFWQIVAGAFISLYLYQGGFLTDLYIPFYKYPLFDMGIFAIFFWIFVFVATSNAVNLTDGLDGLATVPSIFSIATLSVFVYVMGHAGLSQYLLVPNVKGVGEVTIVATALMGSLIGFLWYNCHPAEIFMGDSGSLTLGGFIAYMAIVTKNEILLILIGFVFVMETVSVILQVGSYKARKKRVFRMAPIHHHFELKGWAENKIIVRFWIMALISNLMALITLKIR